MENKGFEGYIKESLMKLSKAAESNKMPMKGKMPMKEKRMKDHVDAMMSEVNSGSRKHKEGKPGSMKPEDCTTCKR